MISVYFYNPMDYRFMLAGIAAIAAASIQYYIRNAYGKESVVRKAYLVRALFWGLIGLSFLLLSIC
jgi:hypothetical protein